jgi:hypothetical protein
VVWEGRSRETPPYPDRRSTFCVENEKSPAGERGLK